MTDSATAAFLSDKIYQDLTLNQTLGPDNRYEVKDVRNDLDSGYYGAIIHDNSTGERILVSRGTQLNDVGDIAADIDIAFGGSGGNQFNAAQNFLQTYNSSHSSQPDFVPVTTATGHSLGGLLSQGIGIANNLNVITFGSPGGQAILNNLQADGYPTQVANYDYAGKMTNFVATHDPVGNFGAHIQGAVLQNLDLNPQLQQTVGGVFISKFLDATSIEGADDIQDLAGIIGGPAFGLISLSMSKLALDGGYHSSNNYWLNTALEPTNPYRPDLTVRFDLSTSSFSAYEKIGEDITNYDIFDGGSLSRSLDSLGIAVDISRDGWGSLSSTNANLDDLTYNFGGSNLTLIPNGENITLPSVPRPDSVVWVDNSPSDYFVGGALDDYLYDWTSGHFINLKSPLTLDLDGDGIETSHVREQNVFFDIDNDGFAEKVGWIDADDGQLALDRNGDGIINDVTELFSDYQMPAFDQLRLLDSNLNGMIDPGDERYGDLLVWRDFDQDGFSDEGELFALTDPSIQIREISLVETPLDEFQNENYFSGQSTFTRYDNTSGDMVDVHFLNDNVNTWFLGAQSQVFGSTYEVSPEALLMPLSRGYGALPSLHIAMTDNTGLRDQMRELINLDGPDMSSMSEKMEAFLFEWAGVTDNDPAARKTGDGSNIDARKVDFIEKFTDTPWLQMGVSDLVGADASVGVKKIWAEIENIMTARVLVQGTLKSSIFQNASYDFVSDNLTLGDSMGDLIARASSFIDGANDTATHDFWLSIGSIFVQNRSELGVDIDQISDALDTAYGAPLFIGQQVITPEDGVIHTILGNGNETLTTNVLTGTEGADTITGSNASDYIFGKGGGDVISGRDGDDFLRGDDGADTLSGGAGDDRLEGAGGDDVLIGGGGRDDLRGGDGDDTISGGDGDDIINGGLGSDVLDGGSGTDKLDLEGLGASVHFDMRTGQLIGAGVNSDTIRNFENIGGSGFSDQLIGDGNANVINGEGGNDTISGGAGDDQLFGADGDDQIFGGAGNDVIDGYEGNDRIVGGEGDDTLNYLHPYNEGGVIVDLLLGQGFTNAAQGDTISEVENLIGSRFDDVLVGDNNDNILEGREGNDIIRGEGGDDTLIGGSGVNQYVGGDGHDNFVIAPHANNTDLVHDFQPGIDRLDYSAFTGAVTTATTIEVTATNENTLVTIDGQHRVLLVGVTPDEVSFSDFILPPETTLTGLTTLDPITDGLTQNGDEFGNHLFGTDHNDEIQGGGGNDTIVGRAGDDVLSGGAGFDTIIGGLGADTIYGGLGVDQVDYADAATGVEINVSAGTGRHGTAEGDIIHDVEAVNGGVFNDTITGNEENNLLDGRAGDDIIDTGGGTNNILVGGLGNDVFVLQETSGPPLEDNGLSILKNNGDSTFTATGGRPNGIDLIKDFEAGNPSEAIDLSNLTADSIYVRSATDLALNGESISGTVIQIFNGSENQTIVLQDVSADDLIPENFVLPSGVNFADFHWQTVGSPSDDILLDTRYDDEVFPGGGQDIVLGGEGNDTVYAQSSNPEAFVLKQDEGSSTTIYGFDGFYNTYHWFPGGPTGTFSLGPTGQGIVGSLTSSLRDIIDLRQFAGIRNFNDLTVTYSDTDNNGANDRSTISLTDGQEIILEGFAQAFGQPTLYQNTFNIPEHGITGYGFLFNIDSQVINANTFEFNDGTLTGSTGDDTLKGGYASDAITAGAGDDLITGAGDNDTLLGGNGNDTLSGGLGSDVLTGGDNADTFVIARESGVTDTITDLEFWRIGEIIDLSAFNDRFASFAALKAAMSQQGADTHIDLGDGQTLIIQNINLDDLRAQNFSGNAGINTSPTAEDDIFQGLEDQPITGNVLDDNGNGPDTDPNGDPLNVVAATIETDEGGEVVLNTDGSFSYTPAENFNGPDSFTYTASDGLGGLVTARVTLTVGAVNDDPEATDDAATTNEDTPVTIDILANDSDIDGDTLTPTIPVQPAHGTALVNNDGTISFTPEENYNGDATIEYQLSDGNGGSSTGRITVTVNNVNDAPVAQNDAFTGDAGSTISGNVLEDNGAGTDSDIDGDGLSVVAETITTAGGGTVVIEADGDFEYTPSVGGSPETDNFSYTLLDGQGGSATANVSLTFNAETDAPPVLSNNGATMDEDGALILAPSMLSATDTDTDAANLQYTLTAVPDQGLLRLDSSQLSAGDSFTQQDINQGRISFVPNENVNGGQSFGVTLSDGTTTLTNETFSINIGSVNDAPVARNDAFTDDAGAIITGNVLADNGAGADNDIDGDPLSVVAETITTSAGGTVVIEADGDFEYTPSVDGSPETDNFSYTVLDGQGGSATANVSLTFNAEMDAAPILSNNGATMDEDGALILAPSMLSAVDADTDAANLQYTLTAVPDQGLLRLDSSQLSTGDSFTQQDINQGRISFVPNENVNGGQSFSVTLSDGTTTLGAESFSINITPVNDAPVAVDDSFYGAAGADINGNVLADNGSGADSDVDDGDVLAATTDMYTTAEGGSFELDANGEFSYTPRTGFTGTDTVSYELSDGKGGTDTGLVSLIVEDNDSALPTLAIEGTQSVTEGNSGVQSLIYTFKLSSIASEQVTFNYAIGGGNATAGSDYSGPTTGSLAIEAGSDTATITLDVIGDRIFEDSEGFRISIANLTGAVTSAPDFDVTITNDDQAPPPPDTGSGSGGGGSGGGGSGGGGGTPTTPTTPTTPPTTPTATTVIGSGPASVTATAPTTVGVATQGPGPTADTGVAASNLTNALNTASGSGPGTAAHGAAANWLSTLTPGTSVDVQSVTLTSTSAAAPGEPIVISGDQSGGGAQEAYAIDVSQLPAGTTIHLNNLEFISITGSASFGGGAGSSYVVADDDAQRITLGEDDDTILGGGGDDYVGSLDGNDLLYGNQGADTMGGGLDNDTLYGGQQADIAYGNQGADAVYGNFQNDTLYGGQDADSLYGGQNEDAVYGNLGDDILYGNLGLDKLYGGQGNDLLLGGDHADILWGNRGNDTLVGGDGADAFYFGNNSGSDTVADFNLASGDILAIRAGINGTGIANVADILQRAAADGAGNTVLDLGNGDQVTLIGVMPENLATNHFTLF